MISLAPGHKQVNWFNSQESCILVNSNEHKSKTDKLITEIWELSGIAKSKSDRTRCTSSQHCSHVHRSQQFGECNVIITDRNDNQK